MKGVFICIIIIMVIIMLVIDSFGFLFLLGGLGGAAVVSAARPRPVYAVNSAPYQAAPYQVYGQYPPAGYNYYGGYNYYPPYYR